LEPFSEQRQHVADVDESVDSRARQDHGHAISIDQAHNFLRTSRFARRPRRSVDAADCASVSRRWTEDAAGRGGVVTSAYAYAMGLWPCGPRSMMTRIATLGDNQPEAGFI
jgi:hypothetical protein